MSSRRSQFLLWLQLTLLLLLIFAAVSVPAKNLSLAVAQTPAAATQQSPTVTISPNTGLSTTESSVEGNKAQPLITATYPFNTADDEDQAGSMTFGFLMPVYFGTVQLAITRAGVLTRADNGPELIAVPGNGTFSIDPSLTCDTQEVISSRGYARTCHVTVHWQGVVPSKISVSISGVLVHLYERNSKTYALAPSQVLQVPVTFRRDDKAKYKISSKVTDAEGNKCAATAEFTITNTSNVPLRLYSASFGASNSNLLRWQQFDPNGTIATAGSEIGTLPEDNELLTALKAAQVSPSYGANPPGGENTALPGTTAAPVWIDMLLWGSLAGGTDAPVIPQGASVQLSRAFTRTACTPGRGDITEPGQNEKPVLAVMAASASDSTFGQTFVGTASAAARFDYPTNVGLVTTHGTAGQLKIWRSTPDVSAAPLTIYQQQTATGLADTYTVDPEIYNRVWDKVDWAGSANNTWMAYYPSQSQETSTSVGGSTAQVRVYDMFPLLQKQAPRLVNTISTSVAQVNQFGSGAWQISYSMQPNGVLWMAQYGRNRPNVNATDRWSANGKTYIRVHMYMLHYYDRDTTTQTAPVELKDQNLLIDGNEIRYARWEYHGDMVISYNTTGIHPWVRGFTVSETNDKTQFVFNTFYDKTDEWDEPTAFRSGGPNENIVISVPAESFDHLYNKTSPYDQEQVDLTLTNGQVSAATAIDKDKNVTPDVWWAQRVRSTATGTTPLMVSTMKYIATGKLAFFASDVASGNQKNTYVIPLNNLDPAHVETNGLQSTITEINVSAHTGMTKLIDSTPVYGGGSLFYSVNEPEWKTQTLEYGVRAVRADGGLTGSESPINGNLIALNNDGTATLQYRINLNNRSLASKDLTSTTVNLPVNINAPTQATIQEAKIITDASPNEPVQATRISDQSFQANLALPAPALDSNTGAMVQVKVKYNAAQTTSDLKCSIASTGSFTGGVIVSISDNVTVANQPADTDLKVRAEVGENQNSASQTATLKAACLGMTGPGILTLNNSTNSENTVVAVATDTVAFGRVVAGASSQEFAATRAGEPTIITVAGASTQQSSGQQTVRRGTYAVSWYKNPNAAAQAVTKYTTMTVKEGFNSLSNQLVTLDATARNVTASFSTNPLFNVKLVPDEGKTDTTAGEHISVASPVDTSSGTDLHRIIWRAQVSSVDGTSQAVPTDSKLYVMPSTPSDQNVFLDKFRYDYPSHWYWTSLSGREGDSSLGDLYPISTTTTTHYPQTGTEDGYAYVYSSEWQPGATRTLTYKFRTRNASAINVAEGKVGTCTARNGQLVFDDHGVLGNAWLAGTIANPYQNIMDSLTCTPLVEDPDLAIGVHDETHAWADTIIGHPVNVHPDASGGAYASMVFRFQMHNTKTTTQSYTRTVTFNVPANTTGLTLGVYRKNGIPTETEMGSDSSDIWDTLNPTSGSAPGRTVTATIDFGSLPANGVGTAYVRIKVTAGNYVDYTKQEDMTCTNQSGVFTGGVVAQFIPVNVLDGSGNNNQGCYPLIGETSGAPFIVRTVDADNNYVDGSKFKLYNATIDAQGVITANSEVTDPWVRIYGKSGNLLWCETEYCPNRRTGPESFVEAIQHAGAVKTKDLTLNVPYLLVQTQVPVGLPLPPQLLPEGVLLKPTGSQLLPYDRTQNQWVDPGHTNTAIVDGGIVKVHVGPLATGTAENSLLPAANAAEAEVDDTVTPVWQVDIRNPLAGELPVAGGRGPLPIVFAGLILVAAGMLARRRLVRL